MRKRVPCNKFAILRVITGVHKIRTFVKFDALHLVGYIPPRILLVSTHSIRRCVTLMSDASRRTCDIRLQASHIGDFPTAPSAISLAYCDVFD
jgi:hypothetical protein